MLLFRHYLGFIDAESNGVPAPRIIEVASPMAIATFVDNEENRSFAPSRYLPYTLSPSTIELLARNLPTYPGDKESLVDPRGDQSGIVTYTSLAFGPLWPVRKKKLLAMGTSAKSVNVKFYCLGSGL